MKRIVACTFLLLLFLVGCGDKEAVVEPTPTPLPPQLFEFGDQFRSNILGTSKGFLFCQISLEASSEEDLVTITENENRIRDLIVDMLRGQNQQALQAQDATTQLSVKITELVEEKLGILLKDVYFSEYYTSIPSE
jgi:flagellar basal body-associated protein FliL